MICLFFISGSTFNKQIPINKDYIKFLKSLGIDLFIVKKLDYLIINEKYKKYKTDCEKKFTKPIVGIMGISSGGYYANKLNNQVRRRQKFLLPPRTLRSPVDVYMQPSHCPRDSLPGGYGTSSCSRR